MTASYPMMFRVRQTFDSPRLADIPAAVEKELASLDLGKRIKPGQRVAITAGSRGIANIHVIVRGIAQHLLSLGAKPFVVPAMGSHGGGTVEGQVGILTGYGITEEFVGCPILATMETVVVCRTPEGIPVHFDRNAFEADHVVVCGRIKPHTNFHGDVESGLMKMMLIGLGKHNGAKIYHRAIQNYSFGQIVRAVAGQVLEKCRIVAGLGIVENGYDETALVKGVAPEEFEAREKELLILAKSWMPRLPFDQADVLLVEQLGKDISGAGMDTNVIGRKGHIPDELPRVRRIIVRGLTEATHGNAAGIGYAEFCKTSVVNEIDFEITKINCLTGGHPEGGRTPIHYETDRELLDAALGVVGLVEPSEARILWIRDTLHLAEVECSVAYLDEARTRPDLQILIEPRPMPLDEQGQLCSLAEFSKHRAAQLSPA